MKFSNLVISVDISIVHTSSAFSTKCISIYMELPPPDSNSLKSVYNRELSNYKYLQQDLFLDKKLFFYVNSMKKIALDKLVAEIGRYI